MVTDNQTNFLFLADSLPLKYGRFYHELESLLQTHHVEFGLLPKTNDIWAVDYMPIQISENLFVRFKYNPSYLKGKKFQESISDTDTICKEITCKTKKTKILLDGGNVVKCVDKVIITNRVFSENPELEQSVLIEKLKKTFKVNKLFVIPRQPGDFTGHADGMIRFYDSSTLLINDYKKESKKFVKDFENAIAITGLATQTIPYNQYENKKMKDASGIYINYLEMERLVIVPTFGMDEDDEVVELFTKMFSHKIVCSLNCKDIAVEGGILNCISWNIMKKL